jgi:hypothetical protein
MNIVNLNNLRNAVQSCHINFLFGSGCSRPYLGTLGNIEKWLTELVNLEEGNPLIPYTDRIEASLLSSYINCAMSPCIAPERLENDNYDITLANYIEFYSIWNSILASRANTLIGKKINVFTTNIDLFNEEAIAKVEVEFNDGFKGRNDPIFREEVFSNVLSKLSPLFVSSSEVPTFNLLKIHGSINWKDGNGIDIKYDAHCETLKRVLEKLGAINNVIIPIPDENKSLSELWTEGDIMHFGKDEKTAEIKDFIKEYDKLVMINPKKTKFMKSVIDHHFYELMRIYSNSLESQNSLLFVSGFSFADEHMANLTVRCANNNPTLTIVIFSYNDGEAKKIRECLHKGGTSRHDNIVVITPREFLSQQDESYKDWVQRQTDHKLEWFDLATINKFVYQQLKQMI